MKLYNTLFKYSDDAWLSGSTNVLLDGKYINIKLDYIDWIYDINQNASSPFVVRYDNTEIKIDTQHQDDPNYKFCINKVANLLNISTTELLLLLSRCKDEIYKIKIKHDGLPIVIELISKSIEYDSFISSYYGNIYAKINDKKYNIDFCKTTKDQPIDKFLGKYSMGAYGEREKELDIWTFLNGTCQFTFCEEDNSRSHKTRVYSQFTTDDRIVPKWYGYNMQVALGLTDKQFARLINEQLASIIVEAVEKLNISQKIII